MEECDKKEKKTHSMENGSMCKTPCVLDVMKIIRFEIIAKFLL